jgi:hypothetical protein
MATSARGMGGHGRGQDVGAILVEHARRCIEEVAHFISENYGTVHVERAMHGQPMAKDSQLLGLAFEPAKPPECN